MIESVIELLDVSSLAIWVNPREVAHLRHASVGKTAWLVMTDGQNYHVNGSARDIALLPNKSELTGHPGPGSDTEANSGGIK